MHPVNRITALVFFIDVRRFIASTIDSDSIVCRRADTDDRRSKQIWLFCYEHNFCRNLCQNGSMKNSCLVAVPTQLIVSL